MAKASSSFKKNGAPTLYTLRKVLGLKAKSPSARNRCIGAALAGKEYPKPEINMGGRNDINIQNAFREAVKKCPGVKSAAERLAEAKAAVGKTRSQRGITTAKAKKA